MFLNNTKDKYYLIDESFEELRTYSSYNKTYTIFDEKILLIISNWRGSGTETEEI